MWQSVKMRCLKMFLDWHLPVQPHITYSLKKNWSIGKNGKFSFSLTAAYHMIQAVYMNTMHRRCHKMWNCGNVCRWDCVSMICMQVRLQWTFWWLLTYFQKWPSSFLWGATGKREKRAVEQQRCECKTTVKGLNHQVILSVCNIEKAW